MEIEIFIYHTVRHIIVLTFVLSIIFLYKNTAPGYLKYFPLYHAASICTEFLVDVFFTTEANPYATQSNVPYNIFTLGEFLFFSFYIYKNVKTGKGLIISTTIGFITFFFFYMRKSNFELAVFKTVLVAYVFLFIECIVYFNDVFTTFSSSNLAKEPAFWIVIGILYYSIIISPTHIYRLAHKLDSEVRMQLYITANSTAYILMYLLFLKAYTCKAVK